MNRITAFLRRLFRRDVTPLPADPFGEPGGPVTRVETPDSVALSQLPTNTMRAW
ncbi:hypothetical protein HQQ81_21930 [Microbacteriaceae bacterium VKM Ac-2854]|nr:hypothetical protein [Microbacteriaceae bacterium VKM Ac-2854]